MRRFLVGDELGNIKAVTYLKDATPDDVKTTTQLLWTGSSFAIQALTVGSSEESQLLAAGFSNGSASVYSLPTSNTKSLERVSQWQETRLKDGHRYIGLHLHQKGTFSCTSNGALRLTSFEPEPESQLSVLPTRLNVWRMSSHQDTFAYGGDEVDVSVWDTEQAFASHTIPQTESKKRKRDVLFPGELWRAKNVQNDNLGLRQPLRITALTYLSPSSASHHLAAGTELGNVRRYDTRAARRPVSDWKVAKVGGIKTIEKGTTDHQLFASDHGSNLYSLDLRNGQIAYGYKGISGAVTSSAPSPSFLASTALDRFVRIHSTFPLPRQIGQQQEQKGEVLEKVYMKSIPTVVVWDGITAEMSTLNGDEDDDDDDDDDDVWETMVPAGTEDVTGRRRKKRLD